LHLERRIFLKILPKEEVAEEEEEEISEVRQAYTLKEKSHICIAYVEKGGKYAQASPFCFMGF